DGRAASAVRKVVGPDIILLADANQGYTARPAIEAGRQLEAGGFAWLGGPGAPAPAPTPAVSSKPRGSGGWRSRSRRTTSRATPTWPGPSGSPSSAARRSG